MITPQRFAGRTAIVTGAASGIGAATATRLAAEGAAVVLLDVNAAGGAAVAGRILDAGGIASFLLADVADPDDWAAAAALARERHGGIDVLHSNAYLHRTGNPQTLAPADWHRVVDVNLTALYLGVRAVASDLLERRGTVVVTTSVHALMSLPGYTAYAAAKGGLQALTRQLAAEYAPRVRVNAVIPGPIDTGVWDSADIEDRASAERATLVQRMGTPDEVAAAVCFLASDEAAFVTGASLVVDGGWSVKKDST